VQVINVHLPVDRETGSRRPFGFVEFDTEAEADRALAATSHSIAGRDVSILPMLQHFIAVYSHCMALNSVHFHNKSFVRVIPASQR